MIGCFSGKGGDLRGKGKVFGEKSCPQNADKKNALFRERETGSMLQVNIYLLL
jgi:hypothetical protein